MVKTMDMQRFEAELSAEFGGPALGAWPRRAGERVRPGKGGGDPGAAAREQEAERQARIRSATDEINNIFANKVKRTREVTLQMPQPFGRGTVPVVTTETYWEDGDPSKSRDVMYGNQRSAVFDLNRTEVDRQAKVAERANRFGLARTGLLGGSADVDSVAELDRRTNDGLLRAGSVADQSAADLKAADEKTRSNLISMAQSGIDTGTAAQMTLQGLDVNAQQAAATRNGSTIGGLFNDLSQAYLYNQARAGTAAGSAGSGSQWLGVSSPSTRYQGNS